MAALDPEALAREREASRERMRARSAEDLERIKKRRTVVRDAKGRVRPWWAQGPKSSEQTTGEE